MATESPHILEPHPVNSGLESEPASGRAEIDTSAPFESVKEAANRFGGMGFWKPISHKHSENASEPDTEMVDVVKVEEQAAQLERDLIAKERETLDVLKELETTKNIVEELKLKLQKEASEINVALKENSHENNVNLVAEVPPEGKPENVDLHPSSAPGFILMELKQAKLNLTRTTNDLADIRATVDLYNKKIEKERAALEKTRLRLSSNTSKISCLEGELNQTRQKQELVKDAEAQGRSNDPLSISRELQKLSSETEQFKKVGEAARSEVERAMSEIEQTRTRIRTAEIRLVAAKKMKEAARASEAVALAEIKALSKRENKSTASNQEQEDVTLTFEEYSSLISKARGAEEACKGRVADAMLQVDEANVSKIEILKKVEEATEEVKVSKRALEEALSRVEAANQGKLAVEEALRMWRSEHGHKRRSIHNSTKFKNSHPSAHRKESRLLDVNGLNLVNEELKPVLKPTLSIGQILSRKLLLTEEYENGMHTEKNFGKRKVSLGQMLSKPNADPHSVKKSGKENDELPAKRKKFGFARISLLVTKQKKKKKPASMTTNDLADIRATVDLYNKKIEKERAALEKTRLRLSSNTSKISCLEGELNQTRQKQELVKDAEAQGRSNDPLSISRELQKLSSETEQFKKVGEAARSEVERAMSEIEQTRTRIRTAEIRLVAAKKMKEAARASEAVALAEIKALSKRENKSTASNQEQEDVTLTFEEYSSLISKARGAEEACKGRVADAMLQVDEANVSKIEILKKVEEATEEVKVSKRALEEALSRVEAANQGKLAVEEALRMWRSEHGHKRRSIHNSTKFKNSHPSAHRKESRLLDVNGLNLVNEELKPVLKPTLSIGQILSRKLLLTEEYENGMHTEKNFGKRKVSLGQMLSKPNADPHSVKKSGKENDELPAKRKKFGFARISLLVTKQKKKKKPAASSMYRSA
ncbi:hypothetical protein CDL12_11606 [Handroanthus impetiginosus]|uniref:WEB family protein n=1 Tax=Handroanthus impetiginosus TaxID=429701 RepID=A0A2G9HDY0_9LAMI|nr:hypothetical protein CDL12_11606 [Handroanthus impetiginosus]